MKAIRNLALACAVALAAAPALAQPVKIKQLMFDGVVHALKLGGDAHAATAVKAHGVIFRRKIFEIIVVPRESAHDKWSNIEDARFQR